MSCLRHFVGRSMSLSHYVYSAPLYLLEDHLSKLKANNTRPGYTGDICWLPIFINLDKKSAYYFDILNNKCFIHLV